VKWATTEEGSRDGKQEFFIMQGKCGEIQIPTDEELVALNAMRAIKGEVTTLKRRIDRLKTLEGESTQAERLELERKVDRFKTEWQEWEGKRRDAARRRMVLLGHEVP
jgi:hypothetical protein